MSCKKLTPASTAIGLPRWSISNSSSSMVLFIEDVMLGMRDLITDSKCWRHDRSLIQLCSPKTHEQRALWIKVHRGFYLGEKFGKIFWTHSTCQVCIIRTRCKVFLLPSSSSNHVNILIDVGLWTVNNSHPRMLQPVRSSFKDLRKENTKTTNENKKKKSGRKQNRAPSVILVIGK